MDEFELAGHGEKPSWKPGGGGGLATAEKRVANQREVKFVDCPEARKARDQLAAAFAVEAGNGKVGGESRKKFWQCLAVEGDPGG